MRYQSRYSELYIELSSDVNGVRGVGRESDVPGPAVAVNRIFLSLIKGANLPASTLDTNPILSPLACLTSIAFLSFALYLSYPPLTHQLRGKKSKERERERTHSSNFQFHSFFHCMSSYTLPTQLGSRIRVGSKIERKRTSSNPTRIFQPINISFRYNRHQNLFLWIPHLNFFFIIHLYVLLFPFDRRFEV